MTPNNKQEGNGCESSSGVDDDGAWIDGKQHAGSSSLQLEAGVRGTHVSHDATARPTELSGESARRRKRRRVRSHTSTTSHSCLTAIILSIACGCGTGLRAPS